MKIMVFDSARCNGCYNCQIACKDEHVDNDWFPYAKAQPDTGHFWMRLDEVERGHFPKVKLVYIANPCMHCEEPPCLKVAPDGAVYKRDDGIVIIDPEKSIGQRQIVDACPYGAIYWNEELGIPQKCTFCAHLLDQGWKTPRCVEACPTAALRFGEYEELKDLIDGKGVEVLHPEFGTEPKVYYIGLPKRFVAGAVFRSEDDEPLEDVEIKLVNHATGGTFEAKTDNYGDFELEGLEINGEYSLTLKKKGYYQEEIKSLRTEDDIYLGKILLKEKR